MSLTALSRLGASDERLAAFATHYSRILRPKPADETALIAEIEGKLAHEGLGAMLPAYFQGVGSVAFHGLIRLAYAIEAKDDAEIAESLAAWKLDWVDVGRERASRMFPHALDAFTALRDDERFPAGKVAGPSIVARLGVVVANPAFADYRHAIADVSLEELAKLSLAIYLATNDFTALHMVTACHSTRVVEQWSGENATMELASALLAAYVTIGRPGFSLDDVHLESDVDWETISLAAIASDDDHVSKFVFSSREEQRHYGWSGYQVAAARKAGAVSSRAPRGIPSA
jgi:hypothetical protein